ncbi:glycosyltransferase [Rubellimicrobium arenae]|uniref:glycosyltransferase n=1 Tax=Rubellimicrobium arenae TaxID=2817372 RepID=UPI001FF00AFA|nr:glycosyltransferase [Rubellimicrobium arenae]
MPETGTRRPKLAFFQWNHAGNAQSSQFLVIHMQDHVACLREYFDVVVINEDCDFAEICDRHEPDLVLFESGYRTHGSRRIEVRNTDANLHLPRLGFHNGDPWCDRRAGFLSDMDHWRIETFFTISTRMADYTPAIADRVFVWPNFINPRTFHDYGLPKTVPVMLTGQAGPLYPWRQAVYPELSGHYACLVTPTFRYESRSAGRMLSGESYARALNASFVAPACGTMGNEFVRKHLEIPGSLCCLLTQRTPVLEAAGFVDMENCVFAEAAEIVDRVDHLLAHPDRLEAITKAGHDLVHGRHTLRHRPQILQWYQLQAGLRPGERIVQPHPFADLTVAAETRRATWSGGPALDRTLLERGRAQFAAGQVRTARQSFEACLALVGYLPEARLELARCDLADGDPAAARRRLAALIATTVSDYGAQDPDPVELAWYLVALMASGEVGQAQLSLGRYPGMSNPLLDRVRHSLARLGGPAGEELGLAGAGHRGRPSVHEAPSFSPEEWTCWLARLLSRCGQDDLAQRLQAEAPERRALGGRLPRRRSGSRRARLYRALDRALQASGGMGLRPGVPPLPEFDYGRLLARNVVRAAAPKSLRPYLIRLRAWFKGPERGEPQSLHARSARPTHRP